MFVPIEVITNLRIFLAVAGLGRDWPSAGSTRREVLHLRVLQGGTAQRSRGGAVRPYLDFVHFRAARRSAAGAVAVRDQLRLRVLNSNLVSIFLS